MKITTLLLAIAVAASAGSTAAYAYGCPKPVAGVQVAPNRGQVTANGYTQYITIQNGAQKVSGPAYLVLYNVTPGAVLANRSGYTDCGAPGKSPFIRINLGVNGTLNPNQNIQALVSFNLLPAAQVTYTPVLVFGHLNGHGVTFGDYDGDGKADRAVLGNDGWFRVRFSSNNGTLMTFPLPTQPGDIAIAGDFDGDGIADPALYRPSAGEFVIAPIGKPSYQVFWGTPNIDKPVIGDYDGDGKSDLGVYDKSTGTWKILRSSAGALTINWGQAGDIPVPEDYDGDGCTDLAIYRPSTVEWWIFQSNTLTLNIKEFGYYNDPFPTIPLPADYDGDGKADYVIAHQGTCNFGNGKYVPCVDVDGIRSVDGTGIGFSWSSFKTGYCPADYDGDGMVDHGAWAVNWGYAEFRWVPGLVFGDRFIGAWPEVIQGQAALGRYTW